MQLSILWITSNTISRMKKKVFIQQYQLISHVLQTEWMDFHNHKLLSYNSFTKKNIISNVKFIKVSNNYKSYANWGKSAR